jgi:pimeloyl-ACP methyl ester carboxylesterase
MTMQASTGFLFDDTPFLRIGQGPPLVMVAGLTPRHEVPTGWERRMTLRFARPLARHFTVYAVNRKRGLRVGESMSDIAGHLADAIEHDLGGPVVLQGMSTGGSVVLQLALDRPDLVQRLVVVASAYRLGPRGKALQAEMAELIRTGRKQDAWASLMGGLLPTPLRGPVLPLARWATASMVPDDPTDVLATLEAEDAFDVLADLPRITAPTLVIGGGKDPFYPRELFEETATGVADGRVHVFEGLGHVGVGMSAAAWNLALGFMLGGPPSGRPEMIDVTTEPEAATRPEEVADARR